MLVASFVCSVLFFFVWHRVQVLKLTELNIYIYVCRHFIIDKIAHAIVTDKHPIDICAVVMFVIIKYARCAIDKSNKVTSVLTQFND